MSGAGNGAPAVGRRLPDLALASTAGGTVNLAATGVGRAVVFAYPMTGRPGVDPPEGWSSIPGAVGCTAEACSFRDHHLDLVAAGVDVYGLSSQDTAYQREAVERLGLPYPLLSDERCAVADALGLPTFTAAGLRLYQRLTLVVADGVVEHVFHPVAEPGGHGAEVLAWLAKEVTAP